MATPLHPVQQPFSETVQGGLAHVPHELLAGYHAVVDLDATSRFHFDNHLHPAVQGKLVQLLDDETIQSLSLATLNPRAMSVAGIEQVFEHVYASRYERTRRGVRLLTKLQPDFYRWIAEDLQTETDQLVVIDNSHVAGLWAAERAGCNTVHVEPLRRTPIPPRFRMVTRADRSLRLRTRGVVDPSEQAA
ncbi:hypothetical protein EKI60_00250 [Candidatus Saccharibacteria bacterium]|nr:MAG: hypothetical protein EKI60_00250 [Candidatus Saccharibacteria bacterium]